MTSLHTLMAKLQGATSSPLTLSVEECQTLVSAVTAHSFVSVTIKYSRYGSVQISDIAVPALTLHTLRNEAIAKWEKLKENDFSIFSDDQYTHEVTDNYLQNAKHPRTLYIKTKQIGFSDFSEAQALEYAGVKDIVGVGLDDARFPGPVYIPDDHPVLFHTLKELKLKHALYNPLEAGCEYTRREFISPVLVLAATIAGVKMACEEQVQGSLGYGPVDWMILYQTHRICITEGKKDSVAQGLHQNLAQLAAAGEGRGKKRQFCVNLPLYGVATTYREWVFLRLDPAKSRSEMDGAIRLPTYGIDDTFDLVKGVQRVASRLAGILTAQKGIIDKDTGSESTKKVKTGNLKKDDGQ